MTGSRSILCAILNCGVLDLEMLDDIGYDLDDVLERCGYPGERLDFNGLMRTVVEMGLADLATEVQTRIAELEHIYPEDRDHSEDVELELLRGLNPEEDITSFHNYLDTHVYCERHYHVYLAYLSDALDEFYKNTGLEIGGE